MPPAEYVPTTADTGGDCQLDSSTSFAESGPLAGPRASGVTLDLGFVLAPPETTVTEHDRRATPAELQRSVAMNRQLHGPGLAPPAANYAHAIVSEPGDGPQRWLHTSGIVPVTPDGTVPQLLADQAAVVWSTLLALLAEADMVPADVVSVTTYVVADHLAELPAVMAMRDHFLGGHLAASTLVTVPCLARPEWKMEVAIVAAVS